MVILKLISFNVLKPSFINSRHLTFYIDSIRITTIDIDKVKRAAGYIWFCRKCLRVDI